MNTADYNKKIDDLLADETKFTKIEKDPAPELKTELNKLISTANARNDCYIPKILGHFEPGYIYGNPKIHKNINDPPLRPIVSQIGTVTYNLAKWLNRSSIHSCQKHM